METLSSSHPAINLSTHLYHQLVYTLTDLLPPPLDGSPEALYARNRSAIAKVAELLPVNANEADLAAQCIAGSGSGRGCPLTAPRERGRHPFDHAAERIVHLDGADIAVRAWTPDARASGAAEAASRRTLYA